MSDGNQVSIERGGLAYNTGSGSADRPNGLFQAAPAFPEPALVDFSVPFVRQVSVNPCLNGYNVGIGCQTVVFRHGQEEELGRELARYLVDPAGVEAEYRNAATKGAELRRGGA